MHDYKFRRDELSFRKPKRRLRKLFFGGVGLVSVAGLVYAAVYLEPSWLGNPNGSGADSDVIPLSLPPHSAPPQGSGPLRQAPVQPAAEMRSEAIAHATQAMDGGTEVTSVALAQGEAIDAEREIAASTEDEERDTFEKDAEGFRADYVVAPGDSLAKIFRDHDLSPQLLQRVLRGSNQRKRLGSLRPGDKLRIRLDEDRRFTELSLQLDALRSIRISATSNGVAGTLVRKETDVKVATASGTVEQTLFASAQRAGVSDAVTAKVASIFGWDIDFALEIRAGDQFSVVYEELWADGTPVSTGEVLAAAFVNQGKTYRAVRYKDSGGKTDYYSPDGKPLKKQFFRTPVDFTRISSGFTKRRWHPVLKRWRAHRGVDYAAPTGTPVRATGDGVVEYKGWKKGYGRVVYLRHGRTYETVYGHLSRFAKGLKRGRGVRQGDVIGHVGQTGMATGPHLHYEFHINGLQRNPLTVKAPIADPLPRKELRRFNQVAEPLLAKLEDSSANVLIAEAR